MTFKNFITIEDKSETTPLWGGDAVYILAGDFSFGSQNLMSSNPKTFQETNLITADASSYISNFNRRKSNVSYGGFNNQVFTVKCFYDSEKIGSTLSSLIVDGTDVVGSLDDNAEVITEVKIFTPSKLMELVLKPRTVYIKDTSLYPLLSAVEGATPAIYDANGIPVVLSTWSFKPNKNNKIIEINMTFIEDKY